MADNQSFRVERELRTEILRLKERIEKQTRHADVLESKLRDARASAKEEVISIEIRDAIEPCVPTDAETRPGSNMYFLESAHSNAAIAKSTVHEPRPWWPSAAAGAHRSLAPTPGWRSFSLHRRVGKVIGISVCDLPEAVVAQIVLSIAEQQERTQDFIPIFLTDLTNFEIFRAYGFVFEYFPGKNRRALCNGTLAWAEYARRRRDLLERKWGIAQIINFGSVEFGRILPDVVPQDEGAHPSEPVKLPRKRIDRRKGRSALPKAATRPIRTRSSSRIGR